MSKYRNRLPRLTVVGGGCGSDQRHVDAICRALEPAGISRPRQAHVG
jgi:methionine synthase I (cobalamin-dependent)